MKLRIGCEFLNRKATLIFKIDRIYHNICMKDEYFTKLRRHNSFSVYLKVKVETFQF